MPVCSGECASWSVSLVCAGGGVYLATIFGLPAIFLRGLPALRASDFREQHPGLGWLVWGHELYSLAAFSLALLGSLVLSAGRGWQPPQSYGAAAALWFSGVHFFNGLFELATGVCPTYGVLLKRSWKQEFIRHANVRRLGALRIASGLLIAVLILWGMG